MSTNDLPTKLAAPAKRALSNAGIHSLSQLATYTQKEVSDLHGIGNNALVTLKAALDEKGLTFKEG